MQPWTNAEPELRYSQEVGKTQKTGIRKHTGNRKNMKQEQEAGSNENRREKDWEKKGWQ